MSELPALSLRYVADQREQARSALRLTLEPEYIDPRADLADLGDVDAMLAMAMAKISAVNRQLSRCPWAIWAKDGTLVVTLALYVWPTSPDLLYHLHLPPAVTSAPRRLVHEARRRKYWISGSREQDLPWILEQPSLSWHAGIGCLDDWSRPIPPPELTMEPALVRMSSAANGVLCVSGTAVGWRHDISIRYHKVADGQAPEQGSPAISRVEADDIPIRATWLDEDGREQEESTELTIPACAKAMLERCPNGIMLTTGSVSGPPSTPHEVYFSSCDGNPLVIRRAREGANG